VKIDQPSAVSLRAVLQNDLQSIARITNALNELGAGSLGENEQIAMAYHLHNLYNAMENSFHQISRSFENQVKDISRWHFELLNMMFLDVSPLRPAVLPANFRPVLNDLRAFRHFFRHSYGCEMDNEKLANLWKRWTIDGPGIISALKTFAEALPANTI
jgi:hypothetical protein